MIKGLKTITMLVLSGLILVGCHETTGTATISLPPGTPESVDKDVKRALGKAAALPATGKARFKELGKDAQKASAFLSGTTARSYSFSHGSQIEHLASNGRTYLWYPGNRGPVEGRWKVEQSGSRARMCFAYGENTYNPVTNTSGGAWECEPLGFYLIGLEEVVAGDPLNLASGRLPFVLPRQDISIAQTMKLADISGEPANKIDW